MDHYGESTCGATKDLDKFKNDFCSNYIREVSYKSKKWSCPLCESVKKRPSSNLETPVIVSMSEEFYKNGLPDSSCARYTEAYDCSLNKKRFTDSKNYNTKTKRSAAIDVDSRQNLLHPRTSIGRSLNNMTKRNTNSFGKATNTRIEGGNHQRTRSKSSSQRKRGLISERPEGRFKNKLNPCKRVKAANDGQTTYKTHLAKLRRKSNIKRMARKRFFTKSRYSHCFGNKKVGLLKGHSECTKNRGLVPKNMGWLWNVPTLGINKQRLGWKPGAVTKPVKELMMHFLANYPCDTLPVMDPPKQTRYTEGETCCIDQCNRSTLQVKKENGHYLIYMNPLKDSENLRIGESPYLSCPPIKFKIEESAKKPNLDVGLQVPMTNNNDTENNINIEFTPPSAALNKIQNKAKRDSTTTSTQFDNKDLVTVEKNFDKTKKSSAGIGTMIGTRTIKRPQAPKESNIGVEKGKKVEQNKKNLVDKKGQNDKETKIMQGGTKAVKAGGKQNKVSGGKEKAGRM